MDNSKFQDLGDLKKFLIEHQNMLEIQGNESSVPTDEPWTILLRGALHKHVLEQRNTAIEEIRKRLVKGTPVPLPATALYLGRALDFYAYSHSSNGVIQPRYLLTIYSRRWPS